MGRRCLGWGLFWETLLRSLLIAVSLPSLLKGVWCSEALSYHQSFFLSIAVSGVFAHRNGKTC